MSKTCAIVPAAGSGIRMGGDKPKQFLELDESPILAHTLNALSRAPFISEIFLIVPEKFIPATREIVSGWEAGRGCRDEHPADFNFSGRGRKAGQRFQRAEDASGGMRMGSDS